MYSKYLKYVYLKHIWNVLFSFYYTSLLAKFSFNFCMPRDNSLAYQPEDATLFPCFKLYVSNNPSIKETDNTNTALW